MTALRRKFYRATQLDVWHHLAVEERLMEEFLEDECRLFLWQSARCVVIGKNQNPWLECRVDLLEQEGARLARRLSGGGAVFHDAGNLNFSFFVARDRYDRGQLAEIILQGLRSLGIPAEMGERDIIKVGDRKISGNAFCYRRNKVLHHGTLLVDADLGALERYLKPMCPGIESRGIASVPSPVMNLVDHMPSLDVDQVAVAIAEAFGAYEASALPDPGDLPAKYESADWLFCQTPRFTCSGETRDGVRFEAVVVKAVVTELTTSCVDSAFERESIGKPFSEFLRQNPQLKVG